MVEIAFNAAIATITGLNQDVVEALRYNFSIFLEDEENDSYAEKTNLPLSTSYGTSRHLLLDTEGGVLIPTGLLGILAKKLSKLQIPFSIERNILKAELSGRDYHPMMRDSQKKLVMEALKNKRGVVQAPTSFGKSYAIGEFLAQFTDATNRMVWVPTINLLYQMQEDLAAFLEIDKSEIGLIGDGKYVIKPITIAIPDTLVSKLQAGHVSTQDYLASVNVLVMDECHYYANPTGVAAAEAMVNTEFRLALSATPWVNNPLLLEAIAGPKILEFSVEEMMDEGIIMRPIIEFHPAPPGYAPARLMNMQLTNWSDTKTMWAYNQLYDYLIVNNAGRNELAAQIAADFIAKQQGPILILVKKVGTSSKKENAVSHAEIIAEILKDKYGIDLPILHGKTQTKKQQKVFEQLEAYEIPGAIGSVGILTAGVSIKSLAGLVLLAGGSQAKDLVQRVGRVLRFKEGKEPPRVWDFVDTQSLFANQSQKRIKTCEEIYPGCITVIDPKAKGEAAA